jgi:acetyl-CoA carboxylase biotin carboxyl carrier protein
MNIDIELVRELAGMLGETGLSEIEVEDGARKIKVVRAIAPPPPAFTVPAAPEQQRPAPPAPEPEQSGKPDAAGGELVTSPMVGTVYLAPEPGADAFVAPGAKVAEGDTLLIVEAMKVMNPILAPRAGTVRALLVDNAQPVEFGQPLILLD